MATSLLHCTAVEKIFLELKLFQLTLHSFVSLFQQGQTSWRKKKQNLRLSESPLHASCCRDERAIVLGGLLNKLLSWGASTIRVRWLETMAGGLMLCWISSAFRSFISQSCCCCGLCVSLPSLQKNRGLRPQNMDINQSLGDRQDRCGVARWPIKPLRSAHLEEPWELLPSVVTCLQLDAERQIV